MSWQIALVNSAGRVKSERLADAMMLLRLSITNVGTFSAGERDVRDAASLHGRIRFHIYCADFGRLVGIW